MRGSLTSQQRVEKEKRIRVFLAVWLQYMPINLISAHQNNLKTLKTYYFKAKKKFKFFKKYFPTTMRNALYITPVFIMLIIEGINSMPHDRIRRSAGPLSLIIYPFFLYIYK